MKLISMTDFVLETINKPLGGQQVASVRHNELEKYRRINQYANFLKQPLKLEMFVPCDDDGNVLDETKNYNFWIKKSTNIVYDLDLIKYEKYQKAKEKVLFEGFEGKAETDSSWIFKYKNNYPIFVSKKGTIEDLVKYNLEITNK